MKPGSMKVDYRVRFIQDGIERTLLYDPFYETRLELYAATREFRTTALKMLIRGQV